MIELKHFNISKFIVFFHLSLNFLFLELLQHFILCLPVHQAVQCRGTSCMVYNHCAASVPIGEVVFTAEMTFCPKAAL